MHQNHMDTNIRIPRTEGERERARERDREGEISIYSLPGLMYEAMVSALIPPLPVMQHGSDNIKMRSYY